MKKRRLTAFLLILALLLSCVMITPAASAAGETQITFGQEIGMRGEEVLIPVAIENNPGIAGFRFRISYNAEDLTLLSAEKGEVLTAGTLASTTDQEKQTLTFLWYAVEDVKGDGVLVNLKFKINNTARGDYPLSVHYLPEDILNAKKEVLSCTVTEGLISVIGLVPVTGVQLSKKEIVITTVAGETLTAVVEPDNATDTAVTWTSSDPTVATVENGVITPIKNGVTTITVQTVDGGMTDTCVVTVHIHAKGFLNHVPEVPATCGSNGKAEHWTCTMCSDVFCDADGTPTTDADLVIDKATVPHDYSDQPYAVKTEEGHARNCKVCGQPEPLAAHTAGNTATCVTKLFCSVCAAEYGTVDPDNHVHTEKRNEKSATEEQEGYTGDIWCTDCNKIVEAGSAIPKLPHTHNMVKTEAKPATHNAAGNIAYYTCTKCGKIYKDAEGTAEIAQKDTVLPQLPHTNLVIRYFAPTATKAGKWEHYCTGCNTAVGTEVIPAGHPFTDVTDSSNWAYSYAVYGKAYRLFKNAAFNGNANITRAEFVTTLCRTGLDGFLNEEQIQAKYKNKSSVKQDFADLKDSDWFAPYARYMKELGIVGGDNNGRFNGNNNITREEVAAMMHRLVKLVDPDEKLVFIEKPVDKFTDMNAVASWFKTDVEWARKSGLFAGDAQKRMNPKANNTRLEMAIVLQRFTIAYHGIIVM